MTKDKGITLIALIITIIVLILLAVISVNMLIGENGIITRTEEAKFKTELSKVTEEFRLYVTDKLVENKEFELGTLNAGKNLLTYNTKPEGEIGNIYTILKNIEKKYVDCFEIIKGELIYSSQNKRELKWALEIGMKINPYLIVDGVLLSADTNLMLMDEKTGTIVVPESVTAIGQGTFAKVDGMKRIIIPATVKEIRQDAFNGNTTLEEIIIMTDGNNGLEKIGSYAFYGCSNLKTIHIPDTVRAIGYSAFSRCTSLEDVTISKNIEKLDYATFAGCNNLDEIEIPEGVKEIGAYAFQNCNNLKKIVLPKSMEIIQDAAFSNDSIEIVEINSENTNFTKQNGILLGNNNTIIILVTKEAINGSTFIVPNTVEKLAQGLESFGQVRKVIISKNVKEIKADFFPSTVEEIQIDEQNLNFIAINGQLCSKDKTKLYYVYDVKAETITLEEGITIIGSAALEKCNNVKLLNMPDTLQKLESGALNRTFFISKFEIRKKC